MGTFFRPFTAILHGRQKLYNSNYILRCSFLLFVSVYGASFLLCNNQNRTTKEIRGIYTKARIIHSVRIYERAENKRHVYVSLLFFFCFYLDGIPFTRETFTIGIVCQKQVRASIYCLL